MRDEMNTPREPGRTEEETNGLSINNTSTTMEASRPWRAAFNAQCTADMMDDVTAYAAKHANWIETRTRRRDPGLVEELVQDALVDTFAGVVTWEPARCSLALHLKSVIRSRVSHELDHAESYPHDDIDDASEHDVSDAMSARALPSAGNDLDRYADEFETRLRELAKDDDAVHRLIDSYRDGITERRAICRVTRLTASAYHNAHRRLKRLVENLPENLRTAAIEAMA